MNTNELKSGTPVILKNGFTATLRDNKKGNIRTALVVGDYTEIGTVYAHDIARALVDGKWVDITLNPKQQQCKALNDALFS